MAPEEICDILQKQFGDAVTDAVMSANRPYVVIEATRWPAVAQFLRDDPRLQFNMLQCITAIDLLEDNKLAAIYDLFSFPVVGPDRPCPMLRHHFAVRIEIDRDDPHVPTVSHLWPTADWQEREAYDMMGIVFDGHPHLVRILLPDDWVGHPLRKDYEFPLEYHGIPATTEYELTNPRH